MRTRSSELMDCDRALARVLLPIHTPHTNSQPLRNREAVFLGFVIRCRKMPIKDKVLKDPMNALANRLNFLRDARRHRLYVFSGVLPGWKRLAGGNGLYPRNVNMVSW